MADFDPSNPFAVVISFFTLTITFLAIIIKLGISLGIFGVFAGIGCLGRTNNYDKKKIIYW